VESCAPHQAASPGGALVLRAHCVHALLGAGVVAQRGVPAEQLGQEVAAALLRDLDARATLDAHAADQMLVYLALAEGASTFRAAPLSLHASTAMWLLERLAGTRFEIDAHDRAVTVRIHPAPAWRAASA
jgi:RNA 3'-terminal phosphate cyclase